MGIQKRNDWLSKVWVTVIAYALAVQMLLGGIVATQMVVAAPLGAFMICKSDVSATPDEPDQPAQPHHQAPCSICAFVLLSPPLLTLAAQPLIRVRLTQVDKRPEAEAD